MALDYRFRTVDFRPAPEGWRIAWLTQGRLDIAPMPGWIIREEFEFDSSTSEDGRSTGARDIAAARVEDWGVEPIEATDSGFWFILGPGEPRPTEDEVTAEIAHRKTKQPDKNA
ncbi:hypothetical protein AB0D14_02055 [Streptomyces sp. NPDC048484]|uniref:hypothetical protein n=1 Tax=Streptomyces sp. NPDC048484 TaxID=3155146 RepID=UPI003423EAF2